MKTTIDFDQVIQSHTLWKTHLKKAIQQGHSELTVVGASNPHFCAFGKWLDSPAGKKLPNYSEVVELHQQFHLAAAKVLELALQGHTQEALASLQLGSTFNQTAARLVNKLGDLKSSFNQTQLHQ